MTHVVENFDPKLKLVLNCFMPSPWKTLEAHCAYMKQQ